MNSNSIIKVHINNLDYKSSLFLKEEYGDFCQQRTIENFFKADLKINKSPFQECVALARLISDKYSNKEKLFLCLSGGLDSAAMAVSFLLSGVDFEIAFLKFTDSFNSHELSAAEDLFDLLGKRVHYIDIDPIHFFESGKYFDYAIKSQTNSPMFAMHAFFAENVPGLPIFSGEAWYRQVRYENKIETYIPDFKEYSAEVLLGLLDRFCISHFFEYSSQVLSSFLSHPQWLRRQVFDQDPQLTYIKKYQAYRKSGFPIHFPSCVAKLTGFEKLHLHYKQKFNSNNPYYFNELFRRPLEKIFPVPTKRVFTGDILVDQNLSRLSIN